MPLVKQVAEAIISSENILKKSFQRETFSSWFSVVITPKWRMPYELLIKKCNACLYFSSMGKKNFSFVRFRQLIIFKTEKLQVVLVELTRKKLFNCTI